MNETEQKYNSALLPDEVRSALEREHAADERQPSPTPQKSGKLPKSVVAVVVGCLVLNFLMMTTVAVLFVVRRNQEKAVETSVAEVSVDEHEGEIHIVDDVLGDIWIPEYTNIEKSTVLTDKIVEQNGFKSYTAGSVPSKVGMDVSEFQTVTDWDAVKAAGVEYVMIRVGRRGYESGQIVEDTEFRRNIEGALAAGLPVGVYFFSQAVTPGEARLEADFVLEKIADYDITYPIAFDWERVEEMDARTYGIQNDQLTALAREFANVIRANGYTPMLYFYKHLGYLQYDLSRLSGYDFWLAEPADKPSFYYRYTMWQYTSEGTVPGVEGTVDLNLCFEPYS